MASTMRSEEVMQANCHQWHWNEFPEERGMLYMINNNSVNRIAGARKRAMGVVRGPSDFGYVSFCGTAYIELKVGNNIQSPEQIKFMNGVLERGGMYFIVKSEIEFQSLIYQLRENGRK